MALSSPSPSSTLQIKRSPSGLSRAKTPPTPSTPSLSPSSSQSPALSQSSSQSASSSPPPSQSLSSAPSLSQSPSQSVSSSPAPSQSPTQSVSLSSSPPQSQSSSLSSSSSSPTPSKWPIQSVSSSSSSSPASSQSPSQTVSSSSSSPPPLQSSSDTPAPSQSASSSSSSSPSSLSPLQLSSLPAPSKSATHSVSSSSASSSSSQPLSQSSPAPSPSASLFLPPTSSQSSSFSPSQLILSSSTASLSPSSSLPSPWQSSSPSTLSSAAPSQSPVTFRLIQGSVTIEYQWTSTYSDINSLQYKELHSELTEHLTKVLKKEYDELFIKVEISNLREGSLIFDYRIYFKITWSVSRTDGLKDVIRRAEGGDKKFSHTTSVSITSVFPTECPEEQKDSSGLARWIIVLIVCVPVIVILLILVGIQKVQNNRLKNSEFQGRSIYNLRDEKRLFVQTNVYNPASSSFEMYQLSDSEEIYTPKTASARRHGKELKTFSPEQENLATGFSNRNFLADGEIEIQENDSKPRDDGDGEEEVDLNQGNQ
ncbi:uncharacterized protein [Porites lutea]|uniref:uncharacterized protein isoform X2 n=1 Tax=Porites lutea TaxID=51062 RepID=UPI003CC5FC18